MKKSVTIILSAILVLILASCSPLHSDNLRIDFKPDKSSNYGYAAALYEDRIYYVSNELGDAGVYSMALDGSDVRLETANPSVTNLELSGGVLYFTGLYRIKDRRGSIQTDTINNHAVYYGNPGGTFEKAGYLDPVYNIKGFYFSRNGYSVFRYGATIEELHLFDAIRSESFSDTSDTITDVSFQYNNVDDYTLAINHGESSTEEILKNVYQFGDLLIITKHIPEDHKNIYWITGDPYVLDSNTGELVLKFDRNQANELKAFYMDEENVYCSYKEMIVILDKETYQVKTTFIPGELSYKYNITYMTKLGDQVYIIADYWKDQIDRTLPLLGEKLYIMNPGTFECNMVLDLGSNQRVIGIEENHIILLDHGAIYRVSLDDEQTGSRTKICDAPSDIDSKNHTIDYAGNWMFIYKNYPENGAFTYGSDSPGQQLLYKINLETGEIIQNDVTLDFSALDKYRES